MTNVPTTAPFSQDAPAWATALPDDWESRDRATGTLIRWWERVVARIDDRIEAQVSVALVREDRVIPTPTGLDFQPQPAGISLWPSEYVELSAAGARAVAKALNDAADLLDPPALADTDNQTSKEHA